MNLFYLYEKYVAHLNKEALVTGDACQHYGKTHADGISMIYLSIILKCEYVLQSEIFMAFYSYFY